MQFPELNTNEQAAFRACVHNAYEVAGGDFGFTDEVIPPDGMNRHQLNGYLSQLQSKGYIFIEDSQCNGRIVYRQMSICLWPLWIQGDFPIPNSVDPDRVEPRAE